MTLAERTREAVRAHPFLHEALRAGVVNYTAAARFLDLGPDDQEAVVAALRRYAADLPADDATGRDVRVSMESGLGVADRRGEALLAIGDVALVPGAGSLTAVLVTGAVDAALLGHALAALRVADVSVEAAGVADDTLVVVVERRAGADALRVVERAADTAPGDG